MQANGRTSQRAYDHEGRRDAGTLLGKLVRYKSSEGGQWDGLSLKSAVEATPKVRSAAYWRDFLGGRRTLDPAYPSVKEHGGKRISAERHSSCIVSEGAMVASRSSDVFCHRAKAAVLNGYMRNDHKTSHENTLNHTTSASNGSETKAALRRRGSESCLYAYASQITNLPGTVYRVEPRVVPVAKYRVDLVSKVATLPGPKVATLEEVRNPMQKFKRCTNTTQETEEKLGVLPAKTGPKLSMLPSASNLPTYRSVGLEDAGSSRKIRFIRKEHYQSSEEVDYRKGTRGRGKNPLCDSLKLA